MLQSLAHGRDDLGDIVLKHVDVGWGRLTRLRQGVRIEFPTQGRPAFLGNLLHQAWIGNVLYKDRANFFLANQLDEPGDIAGRGFTLRTEAHGRDNGDAVGRAQIAQGVMGGDHAAFRFREGGELCFHPPQEA